MPSPAKPGRPALRCLMMNRMAREKGADAMKPPLVAMLAACVALAETFAAGQDLERPPRFELGGDAGAIVGISGEGLFPLAALGPRLSINFTPRTGMDLIGDMVEPIEGGGVYGIYYVQLKHVVHDGGPTRGVMFVTVGTIGAFEYERVPERRQPRPDGSAIVYHSYSKAEVTAPVGLSGGLGVQRVLARRAALRAETQAVIGFERVLIVRGVLGVSVPIGRGYAQSR
jgi:hypothetical protein